MDRLSSLLLSILVLLAAGSAAAQRDLYSDTWAATDALGRELPGFEQCGPPRQGRTVGIFYFLWLGPHGQAGPFDVTKLLAENPEEPKWGPPGAFHHWGESELGYYLSDSEYVITKHLHMLNDAQVDTLIFDVTNAFTYPDVYSKLCEVYRRMRSKGHRTPQICFLTHSSAKQTIEKLYADFYANKLYPELWFYWKGKPLILGSPEGLSQDVLDFFTIRDCWAWTHGKDTWQWLDHSLERFGWHESPDKPEELSVSVAQHPVSNIGRSHRNGKQPATNRYGLAGNEARGLYFAEQWQRALKLDPEFVFVTGWNEWVAQRFIKGDSGGAGSLLGRPLAKGDSYFVDAYNQQYSRDIEPMKAGHTDSYYYQMISYIRRYKGVRKPQAAKRDYSIEIDGRFEDWADVAPDFRDTAGDTMHRDEVGWGNAGRYVNKTGRNDFVTLKVACDSGNVYFYAQTSEDITPWSSPDWMLLLIDADRDSGTGRHGYDLLVNKAPAGPVRTSVHEYSSAGNWQRKSAVPYAVRGNRMELALPRSIFKTTGRNLSFDFHWADNIQDLDDIIAFAVNGDSAPNRRFNYRFIKE
ncbi:MAG: hypothetical protein JW720_09880 [Sedimentisphaerales bacterium]|nr:hypothetical protein [Sedimentisphaerales bacterium]